MRGIVLASHGLLAEGLHDTLTMFSGEIKQIKTICLKPEQDITNFLDQFKEAIQSVDTGDGVVIFCDLLFGTPCNCSAKIINEIANTSTIQLITGMNLSMVLEYVGAREHGMDSEQIVLTGQQGIVDFKKMIEERNNS